MTPSLTKTNADVVSKTTPQIWGMLKLILNH